MKSKALILGVTGQDGSYMAELLLEKGYEVHGVIRRNSQSTLRNISHIVQDTEIYNKQLFLHYGDMSDSCRLNTIIAEIRPDEIYNFAAQSDVMISFAMPNYTSNVCGLGVLNLLESVRANGLERRTRIYQSSTSELFGKLYDEKINENSRIWPRSPYGCAKAYAHYISVNYREAYDMFICSGFLFNHESPRRGEEFVTRKITKAIARIKLGLQDDITLGNLSSKRDWGYAPDYVEACWLMLQQDKPDDYVIATGECYSVMDFVIKSFAYAGLDYRNHLKTDKNLIRPSEVDILIGDSTKAREKLGWTPKVSLDEMVKRMVDSDYQKEYSKINK